MSFVVGGGATATLHSLPLLYPPFLYSSSRHRNTKPHRRVPVLCCSRQKQDPICNKRTFLFMGVAVLPFLDFNPVSALERIIPSPIFVFISSRVRRQRLPSSRDSVRSRRLRSVRRQRMLSNDVSVPLVSLEPSLSDVASSSSVSPSVSTNS
ncbi:MAR-binding filament-like protein 1-1, partial [Trifolium pratense]